MTKRTQRLGSEYRKEISRIIAGPLKDREPLLEGIISVTEADVAPDLKTAKIYISVLTKSPESKERDFEILRAYAGFIRSELASVMRTRTVPALTFLEDKSMEYGQKMDALFSALNKEDQ